MKVRKEQFLLPKTKTLNTSTSKWIQSNMKTSEFCKSVSCASFSSQPTTVEGLPSPLITKLKPDMLLSNGDIIVSGQQAGQLFWQHQDGILRQALLSTENDVKSEEKTMDGEPSLLAITPVPKTQVIKMNDYKVILSTDSLPVSWQENGKKNNTLPTIKPKMDVSPSFVIGEQPVNFTTIANVNVLAQNQFPTIVMKDGKNTLSGNIVTGNSRLPHNPPPKKVISKPVHKLARGKRKMIPVWKIMLKPVSSLLSQTALDHTNKDRIIQSQKETSGEDNKFCDSRNSSVKKGSVDDSATDYSVKNSSKAERSIANILPPSAPNIISTTQNNIFPFNSGLSSKSTESNLSLPNFATKTVYSEDLNIPKSTEAQIMYEDTVEDGGIIMTSDCSVVCETVICANGQTLLDTGVVVETNCSNENSTHSSDNIRNEDFHTDHVETILPSDIDHEEHHTQEYTDNLLSQLQLSSSRILPNMSSSQVSSVLNALVPSDKTDLSEIGLFTSDKSDKEPVKCELTDFVKIENLHTPNIIKLKALTKVIEAPRPKYRVCELNKHTCFRCVNCSFLSLRVESVERHWATEHRNSRSEQLDRQLTRGQIKCLGCTNVVYSKYALQIHLLCDHNVITTEVHELIAATLAANKAKRPTALKTSSTKTKVAVQRTEPHKDEEGVAPSIILKSNIPYEPPTTLPPATDFVVSEPTTVEEESKIPSTLFSDNRLPNDKAESLLPEESPCDDGSKKLVNGKKCSKRLRRNKLRGEVGCETKLYNFRCMVEHCGVSFTTAANLSYHLRCHMPDSEMFRCPECDVSVISWSSLTSHLWRHHGTDIDLYCCRLCSYKCNSYSKLINNHIMIHGDERPFLCSVCSKGFKTTKQLRNHKTVHRARRRLQGEGDGEGGGSCYTCKICSRSFADARILRHHTQNVHNKLRPYLCTFCGHTASSKSSLRMHIRQHTGEKPFSCNECDYVTSDHNSLRRHKMRHSGLRPYQCPHCSYSCIQATTYKAHLKNKHPGMDEGIMFSCPMCPFHTIKKDNYLAHKAEHDLGGNPRIRRKKHPPPSDIIQGQKHLLSSDIIQLQKHPPSSDLIQSAIELIVPGTE